MKEYEEGKKAFWDSKPVTDNPYKQQKAIEWRHGWLAAQDIEKAIESHHEFVN